jgi:hypothetical protein
VVALGLRPLSQPLQSLTTFFAPTQRAIDDFFASVFPQARPGQPNLKMANGELPERLRREISLPEARGGLAAPILAELAPRMAAQRWPYEIARDSGTDVDILQRNYTQVVVETVRGVPKRTLVELKTTTEGTRRSIIDLLPCGSPMTIEPLGTDDLHNKTSYELHKRECISRSNRIAYLKRRARNTINHAMDWSTPDRLADPSMTLKNSTFHHMLIKTYGNPGEGEDDVEDHPGPDDVDVTSADSDDKSGVRSRIATTNQYRGAAHEQEMGDAIRCNLPMATMLKQSLPEKWPPDAVHKRTQIARGRTGNGIPHIDVKPVSCRGNTIGIDLSNYDATATGHHRAPLPTVTTLAAPLRPDSTTRDHATSDLQKAKGWWKRSEDELESWRESLRLDLEEVCKDKQTYNLYHHNPIVAFVSTLSGGICETTRKDVLRLSRWTMSEHIGRNNEPQWAVARRANRILKLNSFTMAKVWERAVELRKTSAVLRNTSKSLNTCKHCKSKSKSSNTIRTTKLSHSPTTTPTLVN